MSLARAFTTRRVRQTMEIKDSKDASRKNTAGIAGITGLSEGFLHRSKTTKAALTTHGSIRNKISAPVALTHTTNMLSYNAPDIVAPPSTDRAAAEPAPLSSSKSDDESSDAGTAASTPPTSPDTPFPDDQRATSPPPNHLSCYFAQPRQAPPADASAGLGINTVAEGGAATTTTTTTSLPVATGTAAFPAAEAPAIPKRAPSHTKKSYDSLARSRSVSRMSEQSARSLSSKASFSFSRSSSSSTSTSVTSTSHTASTKPPPPPSAASASATSVAAHKKDYSETNPFGHELAQVSELVEEFGKEEAAEEPAPQPTTISTNPVLAEEERELIRQGLKKYSAESYISDIQGLMATFFTDSRPIAAVWI